MYCLAREECGTSRWKVGSTCCHVLVVRPGAHRASNIFYVQAQEVPERTGQGKEKGTRAEGRIRTGAHMVTRRNSSTWGAKGAPPETTALRRPPKRAAILEKMSLSQKGAA